MKLTTEDVNDVMRTLRATGKKGDELDPSIGEMVTQLNGLITNAQYWGEVTQAIVVQIMAHCIQEGKTDQLSILSACSQMGVMLGCTLGFRLGLREAGLELGIGASAGSGKD